MKRFLVILITLTLLVSLSACRNIYNALSSVEPNRNGETKNLPDTVGKEYIQESTLLSERQTQILKEVGLPTEYNQLTSSQKDYISAIEDMLRYLEDRYDCEAEYISFEQNGVLNDEQLFAEINGDKVTVIRRYENQAFIYEDDYATVLLKPEYEKKIKNFFIEKGIDARVFADITAVEGNTDDILKAVNAATFIFMPSDIPSETFQDLVKEYTEWYVTQLDGTPNVTRLYLMDEADLTDIREENFMDYPQQVPDENRRMCVLSADGTISVT